MFALCRHGRRPTSRTSPGVFSSLVRGVTLLIGQCRWQASSRFVIEPCCRSASSAIFWRGRSSGMTFNHVSGTFGRVAGIYNRFQYVDDMSIALTRETHLLASLLCRERQKSRNN